MLIEFKKGIDVFRDRNNISRMTTGYNDLDSLLGGGIEPGRFYLFYGDSESDVDFLIHHVLVNCLLPRDRHGFNGKAVYSNCGNYRKEKTLLDSYLLAFLIKAAGLDPVKALEDIYVICSFSEEQQEQTVTEVERLLEEGKGIKLVAVHNIAKLFTSESVTLNKSFGKRITRLQKVLLKLWQTCAQNKVAFIVSCRSKKPSRGRIPRPEGGRYLRHEANVIVYLRKKSGKSNYVTAHLIKHPNRAFRKVDFKFTVGDHVMGRITTSFRTLLQSEMNSLKRSFRDTLIDASSRKAFDTLLRTWSSEQRTMGCAKVPTVLDAMLLMGLVNHRKLIEEQCDRFGFLESRIEKLVSQLKNSVT